MGYIEGGFSQGGTTGSNRSIAPTGDQFIGSLPDVGWLQMLHFNAPSIPPIICVAHNREGVVRERDHDCRRAKQLERNAFEALRTGGDSFAG